MKTPKAPRPETRINIRVPEELHTALRVRCIETRCTMADVVIEALKKLFAEQERSPKRTTK